MKLNKISLLFSAAALLLSVTSALAETKLTVGVGHMCCGSCKKSATEGLSKVATNVAIDGKNITMTLNEDNLVPTLNALRRSGFPATSIMAGNGPATMTIGHLCCAGCKNDLKKTLAESKIENLDVDAITVDEDNVIVKAKAGKSLDLAPVLAAMTKGGFSATKITVATTTAKLTKKAIKTVSR